MKNIIYFGLAIGFIVALALPAMAQASEIIRPDITDTSVGDEVIISPEDDTVIGDEDIVISPNPEGTIGVGAESDSDSSDQLSSNGIWWVIGIVVVIGIGLLFTKKS